MTRDEMITVIQHHVKGGEIEYRVKGLSTWQAAATPNWDFSRYEFRAKPEPLVLYVVYQNNVKVRIYERKEDAEYYVKENGLPATIKEFVEVTE